MYVGGTHPVSAEPAGEHWQINFADTGPGIHPQQTEKIFEPFQSQFEGGTGLGLAIVYQIVQGHEGKVFARSKPGQGTMFVLRLRASDAAAADYRRDTDKRSVPAIAPGQQQEALRG